MENEINAPIIYSINEVNNLASKISTLLKGHRIALFSGDLGSGKTTLIKAICSSLGYNGEVTSPTYGLVNTYHIPESNQKIHHFDLYRIDSQEQLYDVGLFEYLTSGDICLIEWAEIALDLIEEKYIKIQINYLNFDSNNDRREVIITLPSNN